MEKIVCKGKTAGGAIIVEVPGDDGRFKAEHLRGVRCGLSWPTAVSPGYYCLVGQLIKSTPTGKCPLLLLREGQDPLVNSLFQKMANDLRAFCAQEIYADLSEKFRSYNIALLATKGTKVSPEISASCLFHLMNHLCTAFH